MELLKDSFDFYFPESWDDLSQKQLEFVFKLIAAGYDKEAISILALFKWNDVSVVGKNSDAYLLKHKRSFFLVKPLMLAELASMITWIAELPSYPVRLEKIRGRSALPADFNEVPFEKFIIADNLFQGYLKTQDDELLCQLASVLYGKISKLKDYQGIAVFYWMVSLKNFFARKFNDFFQPEGSSSDGDMMGSSSSVEDAMNAQIRALTKGDITKEKEVLSLDTWRALTELNAQAREYKEIKAKTK